MPRLLRPTSFDDAAAALSRAAGGGEAVRIVGGGTKLSWGALGSSADVELHTAGLDRIVAHNRGDLTAVLEAGVPLARAQQAFASAGQMLALDPDLGPDRSATIGGVLATADSGPLRHRYGAPRDLVLGMTVALSDGTIARSGGNVIKNVAGYDVAKLYCGSFGTLGVILSVNVRLHPLPVGTATATGVSADPGTLAAAARTVAAAPLELEALDVVWRSGRGGLLAQCGGAEAVRRAGRVAELMRGAGLEQAGVEADDAELWAGQRAGQRSQAGLLVRVAVRPSALEEVLLAAQACEGAVVGRAAVGHTFVELEPGRLGPFTQRLPGAAVCVVLDAPESVRQSIDPWGEATDAPALELMRGLKARFDPARVCNPGVFVGGI